jgi:hypothetical protein
VFTVLETPSGLLLRFIYDFTSRHYNYFYNVTRTRLTALHFHVDSWSFATDLIWSDLIWLFVSDRLLWPARFQVRVKVTLRLTVSQSVSKSWYRAPFGAYDQIFSTVWQLRSCFFFVGRPLWREDGSVLSLLKPARFYSFPPWNRVLAPRIKDTLSKGNFSFVVQVVTGTPFPTLVAARTCVLASRCLVNAHTCCCHSVLDSVDLVVA